MNEFVQKKAFDTLNLAKKCPYEAKLETAKEVINNMIGILTFCSLYGKTGRAKYFPNGGDMNHIKKIFCTNLFGLCFACDGPVNFKEKQMAQEIVTALGLNVSVDSLLKSNGTDSFETMGQMFIDIGSMIHESEDDEIKKMMWQQFGDMLEKLFPALAAMLLSADGNISDMDFRTMYAILAVYVDGVDD